MYDRDDMPEPYSPKTKQRLRAIALVLLALVGGYVYGTLKIAADRYYYQLILER